MMPLKEYFFKEREIAAGIKFCELLAWSDDKISCQKIA